MNDSILVHDFLFAEGPRSMHVCNAPSPAATFAIPTGRYICDKAEAARDSRGIVVLSVDEPFIGVSHPVDGPPAC
jgi:L-2-hydroxyglutarate oxidase LhgO